MELDTEAVSAVSQYRYVPKLLDYGDVLFVALEDVRIHIFLTIL